MLGKLRRVTVAGDDGAHDDGKSFARRNDFRHIGDRRSATGKPVVRNREDAERSPTRGSGKRHISSSVRAVRARTEGDPLPVTSSTAQGSLPNPRSRYTSQHGTGLSTTMPEIPHRRPPPRQRRLPKTDSRTRTRPPTSARPVAVPLDNLKPSGAGRPHRRRQGLPHRSQTHRRRNPGANHPPDHRPPRISNVRAERSSRERGTAGTGDNDMGSAGARPGRRPRWGHSGCAHANAGAIQADADRRPTWFWHPDRRAKPCAASGRHPWTTTIGPSSSAQWPSRPGALRAIQVCRRLDAAGRVRHVTDIELLHPGTAAQRAGAVENDARRSLAPAPEPAAQRWLGLRSRRRHGGNMQGAPEPARGNPRPRRESFARRNDFRQPTHRRRPATGLQDP